MRRTPSLLAGLPIKETGTIDGLFMLMSATFYSMKIALATGQTSKDGQPIAKKHGSL